MIRLLNYRASHIYREGILVSDKLVVKEVHTTETDWRWNATSLCNSLVSCDILGFLRCLFISNKYILSTLFPSLVFPFGFYVEGFNEAQSVGF